MTHTTEEKIKIVEGAIQRIESGWTETALARGKSGYEVDPKSPDAVCWCAFGALAAEIETDDYSIHGLEKVNVIKEVALSISESYGKVYGSDPYSRIYRLNDRYGKKVVKAVFKNYISELRAQL